MKNALYEIDGVYNIIRRLYLKNFPHKTSFSTLDTINNYVKMSNEHSYIEKSGNDYVFMNPQPTRKSNDVFTAGFEMGAINLESYLSDPDGINAIFQDVMALQAWLESSDFIKEGIATEKMLERKKLI